MSLSLANFSISLPISRICRKRMRPLPSHIAQYVFRCSTPVVNILLTSGSNVRFCHKCQIFYECYIRAKRKPAAVRTRVIPPLSAPSHCPYFSKSHTWSPEILPHKERTAPMRFMSTVNHVSSMATMSGGLTGTFSNTGLTNVTICAAKQQVRRLNALQGYHFHPSSAV